MNKRTSIVSVIAVSATALAGAAYAADEATTPPKETPAQATADRDVGKLSADGMQAFRDLHLTRLAIFNADPAAAKTDIAKAQAELTKAKTDETVFTKAEADLKPPPAAGKTTPAPTPTMSADAKTPIEWLPIDGQLALSDDFVATPQKAAAVGDANKALAQGDQKTALEKLKLADVNVSFTLAVAPLVKTTSDVDQAANLINQGKYYEANAALKQAEDGIRFDMVDVNGMPKAPPAKSAASGMAPAAADKTAK